MWPHLDHSVQRRGGFGTPQNVNGFGFGDPNGFGFSSSQNDGFSFDTHQLPSGFTNSSNESTIGFRRLQEATANLSKQLVEICTTLESKIEKVYDMYITNKLTEEKYLNIIQKLIDENKELRTENKELRKENKELGTENKELGTKVELLEKDGESTNKKVKL